MAKIIGTSGCTEFLLKKLYRAKLNMINSFEDIKEIKENFTGLLNEITNREKRSLSLDIEALKRDEIKFSSDLNKKVSEKRTQLLTEKEEIPTLIEKYLKTSKNLIEKAFKRFFSKRDCSFCWNINSKCAVDY